VDKGTAARALLSDANVSVAIYFGDDRTDADAWREMREMRREGELAHAACILARSAEVHPDVAELADASVDGAEGVRDALQELLIAAEH
jgi:trehalose 6-phosphate phosphatase